MNVLVIPEDCRKDESVLLPIIKAMMTAIGKPTAKVRVCTDPRFRGYTEALDWEKVQGVLEKYAGMIDLFLLCVDRDSNEDRRAKLDGLEKKAQDFLTGNYQSQKKFLSENAWQELEVWILAGCDDLPKNWNWAEIRAEMHPKETYFEPFAKQRSLLEAPFQGRKILALEAAKRYERIRKFCPEDIQKLETSIREWCADLRNES